jgi:hypothetical protein
MRQATLSSCLLVLLLALPLCAQDAPPLRRVSNLAFGLGERLEYNVGYKFITAGKAVFSIGKDPVQRAGRPCYDIRFEVTSLKSLDFLYRVRDRYRTFVDVDGIFPWAFQQSIREGGFHKDFSATFDQTNRTATTTEGVFSIPQFVHDIVSAFYYVRSVDLREYKQGQILYLQNFFDRATHDLAVKFHGRQQVVVDAGTFNCIVVEPVIKSGSLFKYDGKLLLWLSDDDRRIPVKVSTKIAIGSIDATLTGYSGLRGPLASLIRTSE